jgi:hypothetical protein
MTEFHPHQLEIAEAVFTTAELAELRKLSTDTIRSLFENEPGVMIINRQRRGVRRYRTLRIPASVAARVFRRLTNQAA